jgi:tRNA modification GTPase
MKNTIAALSTPSGKGGVGIIRMSGAESLKIASQIFASKSKPFDHAVMNFGAIDADGIRDACYMVYFKSPRSFTGEDTVEFHCHGGEALLDGVLKALYRRGAAPAMRGEFTKRAYLNGKLSLSDAEGVAEVINAENTAAVKAAYRLMSGALSREIYSVQDSLLSVIAALEASLDYPEEVEPDDLKLDDIISRLNALLLSAKKTNIVKRGVNVALLGKPNTGKSSLLNRFTGKDRAIVTDIAGTTRDTLEECIEFDGLRLNFIDTAGLRNKTDDPIEQKGVERSYAAAKGADIILYILDATAFDESEIINFTALNNTATLSEIIVVLNKNDLLIDRINPPRLEVRSGEASVIASLSPTPDKRSNLNTKIDGYLNQNSSTRRDGSGEATSLKNAAVPQKNSPPWEGRRGGASPLKNSLLERVKAAFKEREIFSVSALTGDGVSALLSAVVSRFKGTVSGGAEISVNLRHADAAKSALVDIMSAKQAFRQTECALVDLRNAFNTLGEITGQTATEDVVVAIFEKFFLGK